jgi:molecular chaperone Hsp33
VYKRQPFDRAGNPLAAAGLLVQALPGADEKLMQEVTARLYELPSIGDNAAEHHDPAALMNFWFHEYQPHFLTSSRVEFFCPCSKDRFGKFVASLSESDRQDILTQGPLPLETRCHNCSSTYRFDRQELLELWERL